MATRTERFADKSLNDRHTKILKELMQRPDNRRCADCRKKDPRWASWNLGLFVCIRCSGTHRSMGTHISKVKSADLDTWTPEQIQSMVKWGNAKANAYWEHELPPNFEPPESNIDQWIRAKYDRKQYAMKGPMPNPEDIHIPGLAAPPQTQFASPAPSPQPKPAAPAAVVNIVPETKTGIVSPKSASQDLFDAFQSAPEVAQPAGAVTSSGINKQSILSLYNSPTQKAAVVGQMSAPAGAQLQGSQFFAQPSFAAFGAFPQQQAAPTVVSTPAFSAPAPAKGNVNGIPDFGLSFGTSTAAAPAKQNGSSTDLFGDFQG